MGGYVLRILVITGDFSNYLVPNFYDLMLEVQKLADVDIWHQPGDINTIINQFPTKPDLVFINEFGESNSPQITGLESLTIPYVLLMYDLHYQVEVRNNALKQLNPLYIFTLYRDRFNYWYSDYRDKICWFPHHVNTNIFKDYQMPKDIDYLLMGDVHERLYPLRRKMLLTMQNRAGFVYHPHPGWRQFSPEERSVLFIGERYAREINRAKIFFTCSSIYQYPLLKYFEVLACKTLLLAPASSELADLGFIPGVNFVAINEDDFVNKAAYYLQHEAERQMIAEKGYEMVRCLHGTEKRAQDMVSTLADIIVGSQPSGCLGEAGDV